LAWLLDSNGDGKLHSSEFVEFLTYFGPLEGLMERVLPLFNWTEAAPGLIKGVRVTGIQVIFSLCLDLDILRTWSLFSFIHLLISLGFSGTVCREMIINMGRLIKANFCYGVLLEVLAILRWNVRYQYAYYVISYLNKHMLCLITLLNSP